MYDLTPPPPTPEELHAHAVQRWEEFGQALQAERIGKLDKLIRAEQALVDFDALPVPPDGNRHAFGHAADRLNLEGEIALRRASLLHSDEVIAAHRKAKPRKNTSQ